MIIIFLALAVLALIFGPGLWVRRTIRRYGADREDLQGTGGEFANHLIDRYRLEGVSVQQGLPGEDCYYPETKVVSLSPEHFHGRSISAVAIAAHEVGHALQHEEQHPAFMLRQRRALLAMRIERLSALAMMVTPFIFLLIRIPQSVLFTFIIGLLGLLVTLLIQIINIPVEYDASFNKALPILEEGYLSNGDLPGARKVLKAAALSYVAVALMGLINIGRWVAILRR